MSKLLIHSRLTVPFLSYLNSNVSEEVLLLSEEQNYPQGSNHVFFFKKNGVMANFKQDMYGLKYMFAVVILVFVCEIIKLLVVNNTVCGGYSE